MKFTVALVIAVIVSLAVPSVGNASNVADIALTKKAINWAFCSRSYKPCALGKEAVVVAGCETGQTYSVWSTNGQYKGLFQMGTGERRDYGLSKGWMGIGNNPWDQALSGYNMYMKTKGEDLSRPWHRWSCRPDGSIVY